MCANRIHSKPKGPIPGPIRGIEPDSWAEDTVSRRMPDILQRTIEDNDFLPQVERSLIDMMQGMPDGSIVGLQDSEAPDASDWRGYVHPYLGMNWRQVPWFFAETYFYRRILAETGYFVPGSPHHMQDPFRAQKSAGMQESAPVIRSLISQVNAWRMDREASQGALRELLRMDLWANRGDLSNFPVGEGGTEISLAAELDNEHIIIDERDEALSFILQTRPDLRRLDIVLDNVGVELMADLALADLLLGFGLAHTIRLRLKPYPMFVSDTHREDLKTALRWMMEQDDPELAAFGERVGGHIAHGRLSVMADFFWASPCSMWEMPNDLVDDLRHAQLVIIKGDLNYRRLLGDRRWPFTTPFDDIVCYFPTALLAIRTLKAELACCLEVSQIEWLEAKDPDWLTDGNWGVIQFWDVTSALPPG